MKLFKINLCTKENGSTLDIVICIFDNYTKIDLIIYKKNKYSIYICRNTTNKYVIYYYIYKFLNNFYLLINNMWKEDKLLFNNFVIYNYETHIIFYNFNTLPIPKLGNKTLLINNIYKILYSINNNGNLDEFITE